MLIGLYYTYNADPDIIDDYDCAESVARDLLSGALCEADGVDKLVRMAQLDIDATEAADWRIIYGGGCSVAIPADSELFN